MTIDQYTPFFYDEISDHPLGTKVIKDSHGRVVLRFESWVPEASAKKIAANFGVEVKS